MESRGNDVPSGQGRGQYPAREAGVRRVSDAAFILLLVNLNLFFIGIDQRLLVLDAGDDSLLFFERRKRNKKAS